MHMSEHAANIATNAGAGTTRRWVEPDGPEAQAAEAARRASGARSRHLLTAAPTTRDLGGGVHAATWGYREFSARQPLRVSAGELLRVDLVNELPEETSLHWHGLALRNGADGVPGVTQPAVLPGERRSVEFVVPHPGTHWFHPHVGAQLDRGLYAPLIVEDPREEGAYDHEWVIVLDDWLDGVTATPNEVLQELSMGMADHGAATPHDAHAEHSAHDTHSAKITAPERMGNTLMGADSALLGGDAGDVYYPHFLVNERVASDPEVFAARPGERIRLRILNAGGDTAFRFGVLGHELTVTHTDGYPVEPTRAESIVLGMGERCDAVVTVSDGVFPVIAEALGKADRALALIRTGAGEVPARIPALPMLRTPLQAGRLRAAPAAAIPRREVDRRIRLELTGGMAKYDWGINGVRMSMADPLRDALAIRAGERVAVEFFNNTDMWHPMHLHGHSYQHVSGGPRKDTSIVLPGESVHVEFDADNPGRWLTHCHNIYHGESGMMAVLAYQLD